MPESVVREELESLDIHVLGIIQLRSGSREHDPVKNRPSTTHYIVSVARGAEESKVQSLKELCVLRLTVEWYVAPKAPLQCKCCKRFGHTQRKCRYSPRCIACGGPHISGGCPVTRGHPQCCSCERNHTENNRVSIKWKEARAALTKHAPERGRKSTATSRHAAPKTKQAGPFAEQVDLGKRWNHVFRGGRIVKATTRTPNHNHSPQPVTEMPKQPKVTVAWKTARSKKPKHKPAAVTKPATVKPKKKAGANVKNADDKPTTIWWKPLNLLLPHSGMSLISLTTFPYKHVWS